METTKKKKGIAFKPLVSKSFFAVISKYRTVDKVKIILLADTEKKAIRLWNVHNNEMMDTKLPVGWNVIKVEAKNVC